MNNLPMRAWALPNPKNKTVYEHGDNSVTVKSGGHANWRNNNPGNMVNGSASLNNGSIGSGPPMIVKGKPTPVRLSIFPSKMSETPPDKVCCTLKAISSIKMATR